MAVVTNLLLRYLFAFFTQPVAKCNSLKAVVVMATSSSPFDYSQLRQLTHDYLSQRSIASLPVMRAFFIETILKEQ